MPLNTKQRQQLKARAHALKSIIIIGNKGLTAAVHDEIELALETHELVKIKVNDHDREQIKAMVPQICSIHLAEHVQTMGHVITVWRKNKS